MAGEEDLVIYTIYDHPKDYPNHFVVRRWDFDKLIPLDCKLADSLNAARDLIPRSCIRLERSSDDDPTVVENWL